MSHEDLRLILVQQNDLPIKQLAPHITAPFALCFIVTRMFRWSVKIAMPSKNSLVFRFILFYRIFINFTM